MTDYPSEMHDLSLLNTEELNLNLDNLQFLNVVQVDTSQYTGPVFDLEIETNHNYQVSALGFAHNGGKRPGSFAPYLETWHGDLLSFIDLKRNTGDERYRTYELFPACYVNDLFMKRKFADEMWSFFSPYDCPLLVDSYGEEFEKNYLQYEAEGKAITQLPAREVWRKMLTSLSETGAPWITFKDPINERNPQKHVGMVHSSNLCTEITLNTSANDEVAVCNLGSINAAKFPTDPEERKAHIKRVVKYTHRALDNVIDINYYPHDRARKSNLRHRPIGYGIMGYTEFLVKSGIDWESEAHVEMADNLFEELSYEILSSSVGLAKEKGAYSTFEGSDWSKGILPIHTAKDQSTKLGMETWDALAKEIVTHGLRNSNHMAIAPTATIGNLIGTTACIEPVFEKVYTEEIKSGYFQVTDPCLAYGRPSLCKYAFNIAPQWVIKAAARRQKWIDQSQSLNLFIPKVVTYDDLDETYSYAWLAGLKTTYYLHREQQSYQSRTKQSESKPVDVSSMTEEEREEYEMQQAIEAAKSDLAQQGALKTSFHNISCEGCQ